MKIACQENLVPGDSFEEKVENLVKVGFEAVELNAGFDDAGGQSLVARLEDVKSIIADSSIEVSSICGGQPMSFLAEDASERKRAVEGYKRTLRVAGALNASGPILVPIFGAPQITDPWPLNDVVSMEKDILCAICGQIAPVAHHHETNVILEPLNRYETHLLNSLADGLEICELAGNPEGLSIMADLFHMNIEEPDMAESIRLAGDKIVHVHLADSTRTEPGSGHTDFRSAFAALKEIGYEGYMAFECGLTGEPLETLERSVGFLKNIRDSV
ncbi:MAG: sugar phosphate isomerase/epimerase [Planctomycetes bacterium]|nr:sugar phosphate isomerase/epimerase [Planctomycetota bacterium]